ncbi:hypothetical protein FGH87_26295 [Salmonella enterica]|uniref:Uncharacterized protein n=1 Tax=Salmonella enterica subsp. enterica serovar Lattenkamp TaxID=2564671 RepID=A0A734FVG7_SALET|nr:MULTISPECIES: hypothetical protein [Salmonella]EAO1687897.1 hypothetical protein [Salmonella enterica]EBU6209220.1 hypothetical protein [Salmonella enterica subsp. enterica]ECF2431997.1 hypothetical protein [Salmonella enterica subsp. enterica serovar Beaudesert]EDI2547319.1 hypothetical protein [Salmonella enterica subsp. enterica serovar Koketime]EDU0237041.1 hypothetical protein [Salmonella enterica subsp. enterica serovar Lattenkamp]ELH6754505.1 hypothetical protein [Salmonella enteric
MTVINNVTGNICDVATGVCQSVVLSLNSVPVTIVSSGADLKVSADYFAFAFISTMGLWLFAKSSGVILEFIRKA